MNKKFFEVNFFEVTKKATNLIKANFIKKNILAIIALATVTSFSAFKAAEKAMFAEVWFTFDSPANPGQSQYEDDVIDQSKYTNTSSGINPAHCSTGPKVCAVKATPDENGKIPQNVLETMEDDLLDPSSTNSNISRQPNTSQGF